MAGFVLAATSFSAYAIQFNGDGTVTMGSSSNDLDMAITLPPNNNMGSSSNNLNMAIPLPPAN